MVAVLETGWSMTPEELRAFLEAEAEKPFSGWDFSYLDGRIVEGQVDWSYPGLILQHLRSGPPVRSLLDMGTGGGEFISRLQPFPPFTCVTEAYPPNVPVARARLEPLGVQVFEIEEYAPLPFADNTFDLVINRHEYYDPAEVFRILAPGGRFLTQQVGGHNDVELLSMLGVSRPQGESQFDLQVATAELRETGFNLDLKMETRSKTRVFDAGAVVYYFKALPWEIPDFSVAGYFDRLQAIHEKIQADGHIETTTHRFIISGRKPKGETEWQKS